MALMGQSLVKRLMAVTAQMPAVKHMEPMVVAVYLLEMAAVVAKVETAMVAMAKMGLILSSAVFLASLVAAAQVVQVDLEPERVARQEALPMAAPAVMAESVAKARAL